MTTRSHIEDGESEAFGDVSPSPVARRAGQTSNVIPFKPRVAAASLWLEESAEDDCWEDLGTLAVSLVADWSLPRLLVFCAPGDGEEERHREL